MNNLSPHKNAPKDLWQAAWRMAMAGAVCAAAVSGALGAEKAPGGPEQDFRALAGLSVALIILTLLAMLLVVKAGRVGAAMLVNALWPRLARRAHSHVVARPLALFALGLADAIAGGTVILVLLHFSAKHPLAFLAAVVLASALIALVMLGVTGLYAGVGRRFEGRRESAAPESGEEAGEGESAMTILKGGAALEIGTLIPVLGFFLQVAIVCIGLGCGTLLLFERKPAPARAGGNEDKAKKEA